MSSTPVSVYKRRVYFERLELLINGCIVTIVEFHSKSQFFQVLDLEYLNSCHKCITLLWWELSNFNTRWVVNVSFWHSFTLPLLLCGRTKRGNHEDGENQVDESLCLTCFDTHVQKWQMIFWGYPNLFEWICLQIWRWHRSYVLDVDLEPRVVLNLERILIMVLMLDQTFQNRWCCVWSVPFKLEIWSKLGRLSK